MTARANEIVPGPLRAPLPPQSRFTSADEQAPTALPTSMFRVKGATTIATVTDLRRSANELLQRAEAGESVVVQRNAEAVGVLMSYEAFQKMQELAERLEDLELLLLARQRERAILRGEDRLIPLEEVMRDLGMEPGADHES